MRTGKTKSFRRRKARRQRIKGLVLLTVLLAATVATWQTITALGKTAPPPVDSAPDQGFPRVQGDPIARPLGAPDPPDLTLAGFAYRSVASELPKVGPDDVRHVRQSVLDPSWASVRIEAPGHDEDHYYALFLREKGDDWLAERSVLIEEQAHPKDVETLLTDLPEDLVNPLFPPEDAQSPAEKPAERAVQVIEEATGRKDAWKAKIPESAEKRHKVPVESKTDEDLRTNVYLKEDGGELEVVAIGRKLTGAEAPGFPEELVEPATMAAPERARFDSTEPLYDGDVERGRVDRGLEKARREIEDYPGIAGLYVRDLKSDAGYGVRPDEVFFSASTIKVPVMVAVYRRIDEGKLDYRTPIVTEKEDWAAGAGWLRWETPGASSTVEDALWLMITQSDNVATNALVRRVGGPEYVNQVAASMGARDTRLFWKLSSERAAVPSLDNRTTPRDMATMLEKIHSREAASDFACEEMVGLLEQNNLEWWTEAGVPPGIEVANKGGWLDSTYNDVGLVEYEDRPYALAVFTEYGPGMREGQKTIAEISRAVWLAQTGETVEEYRKEQEKEQREAPEKKEGNRANGD